MRSNYQEIKNFIHNDLGITKEYIQEILKEMVVEEVRKLNSSGFIERAIEKDASNRVRATFVNGLGDSFESNVRGIVATEVGRQIVQNLNIEVTKANSPQGVNFIYHIDK